MADKDGVFDGAKIAILAGDRVLTLLRDDFDWIRCPNHWDLPGGERDPGETPLETVTRELFEELAVTLDASKILSEEVYDSHSRPGMDVHFFVARWDALEGGHIVLGDEGQAWRWMEVAEFLERDDVVPDLQHRLGIAWARMSASS